MQRQRFVRKCDQHIKEKNAKHTCRYIIKNMSIFFKITAIFLVIIFNASVLNLNIERFIQGHIYVPGLANQRVCTYVLVEGKFYALLY